MANEKMIVKEFTQRQVEIVVQGVIMYMKSLERRITAETDQDARSVWQRKLDEAGVLLAKIRLV